MQKNLMLLILVAGLALPASAAEPTVIVVVDANRGALIRWPLPKGPLPPGGYQVERLTGSTRQLVGTVHPGTAAEADQKLAPEKATLAKKYLEVSARPVGNDPKQKSDFSQARLSVELLSLQDPQVARLLGLSIDDRSAPFGPFIVPKEFVADPNAFHIITKVNGVVKQDGNTRNLIWKEPHMVRFLTSILTLYPGDVISSGTPDGVGAGRRPPEFLKPGDVVTIDIDGIGTLTTPMRALAAAGTR